MGSDPTSPPPLEVVCALIRRGGQILIAQRAPGGSLGGKWEFPGGKVEPGETPARALARELREELGVDARVGNQVFEHTHTYRGEFTAHLLFLEAEIEGDPQPLIHQEIRWVKPVALPLFDFLEGDDPAIERLVQGQL